MKGKSITNLRRGDPVSKNWRTVNDINESLNRHRVGIGNNAAAIAELRRRPRDIGSGAVTTYRIVTVESDHYVCHTWDETTLEEGADDVLIARPWEHRNSILSELIAGTTYNYSYTSTTERIADDGSSTETQVIVPYILVSEETQPNPTVICAVTANTGVTVDDVAVTLQDINVAGRAWAAVTE